MADPTQVQRKLAAILAADVAGYSRLMGADEEETLARLRSLTVVGVAPVAQFRNPEHRELFLSGLRLAMGEAE
jgi:class 3 adenylate cyclase